MKTITRFRAQQMLEALAGMALGHLENDTLEVVLDNFDTLKNEVEKVEKMKSELAKRLYQDVKEERLRAFFDAVQKNDTELLEKEYADILPLRAKEIEVIVSLFNKNVEMDIKEIDGKAFRKAVMKAQPETKAVTFEMLAPMFVAEEKQAEDFSELDDLLK